MFLWICQSLRPFSVLLFLGPPTLPLLCSLKTSVFVWGIGSTVLPSRKWNQHQYFGHFRNKGEFKNLEDCCFFLFGWNQCWGRWDSLNFLPADLLRSFLRFFSRLESLLTRAKTEDNLRTQKRKQTVVHHDTMCFDNACFLSGQGCFINFLVMSDEILKSATSVSSQKLFYACTIITLSPVRQLMITFILATLKLVNSNILQICPPDSARWWWVSSMFLYVHPKSL